MKFKNWDDFVETINEYGRHGYIKKKTTYNALNGTNVMIMTHRTRDDQETFVLYDDEEDYDLDFENEPYVKPKSFVTPPAPSQKGVYQTKTDKRKRNTRSENYPKVLGGEKEETK